MVFSHSFKRICFEFQLFFLQYFHFYGDSLVIIVRIVFAVRKHCNTITICNGNYAMHFSLRTEKRSIQKAVKVSNSNAVNERRASAVQRKLKRALCVLSPEMMKHPYKNPHHKFSHCVCVCVLCRDELGCHWQCVSVQMGMKQKKKTLNESTKASVGERCNEYGEI